MQANYARALALVLLSEGGWSNNPKDPGGATMKGVTQAVYAAYRRAIGKPVVSVRGIAAAELGTIYRRQYADAIRFDELPSGVDAATLDPAVNSGVSRGIKWLQAAAGVPDDGHLGFVSMAAIARADPIALINALCDARLGFLHRLKIWSTFGKGWGPRVERVRTQARIMARAAAPQAAPAARPAPKPAPGAVLQAKAAQAATVVASPFWRMVETLAELLAGAIAHPA